MLVEPVAVRDALGGLVQCLVSGHEVGDEIDEQQLPCGQFRVFLYQYGGNQQYRCRRYLNDLLAQAVFVVMPVFMLLFMCMFVVKMLLMSAVFTVFVCHCPKCFVVFCVQRYTLLFAIGLQSFL